MNSVVFLEIGNNTAKCQYCDSYIKYNGDGGKRGYSIKKCNGCGKKNGVAINMKCDVVTFKIGKEWSKKK